MSSITFFSPALQHFLLFGDIKNRKQDNNTQDCEEENEVNKKFMNKMDDMELDMVAGGGLFDTLKEAIKQVSNPVVDRVLKLIDKLSL